MSPLEVVEHYRRRGLSGARLVDAVRRHVLLLEPLDRGFAGRLADVRLVWRTGGPRGVGRRAPVPR